MKIKFLFRKNLKMSPGKLAAQVSHVSANLAAKNQDVANEYNSNFLVTHVVLGVSDKKFNEKIQELRENQDATWYVQKDAGFTELKPGTKTVLGYLKH